MNPLETRVMMMMQSGLCLRASTVDACGGAHCLPLIVLAEMACLLARETRKSQQQGACLGPLQERQSNPE